MTKSQAIVQVIEIPSDPVHINRIESQTEMLAKRVGFDEDECVNLGIAVTEVVANAITHGNKKDANKKVVVTFRYSESFIEISIRDQGKGFKPENVDDPLKPENLYKESGRGIFIVKSLMDKVSYNFYDNGSEVVLFKSIPK